MKMTLQRKIFEAGVELTVEELQAVALAESQLREREESRKADDLCLAQDQDISELAIKKL